MNTLFTRWLPALTLLAWGGSILLYTFDGRITAVLADEFRLYALIAAVLLLFCALVSLFTSEEAACCAGSTCGHGLSRTRWGRILTFAIIALPIALAPFGSKAALDKVLAQNRIVSLDAHKLNQSAREEYQRILAARAARATATADDAPLPGKINTAPIPLPLPTPDGTQPLASAEAPVPAGSQIPAPDKPGVLEQQPTDWLIRTPDGLIVAEVLDLLYAAQDNFLRPDFEGKRVQLVGQFMPDTTKNAPGNRFKAVRMFMVCCAADSRPVATLVEADSLPSFPDMTWVKITGIPTFPIEKGRRLSVLKAEKVEKTEPPEEEGTY